MSVRQWLAPVVCTFFGLYCLVWCVLASSYPIDRRAGGIFVGVLLLLLAWTHLRLARPKASEQ